MALSRPFDIKISKNGIVRKIPLLLVMLAITGSFIYGWYFDHSKQVGGLNWADQYAYTNVTGRFVQGKLPIAEQLHFQIGYPLLGAAGRLLTGTDPFVLVSFLLLFGSAAFCYLAAEKLLGPLWAILFSVLLFAWDGYARSFQYVSDLFAVPWNNQVLFFTMAFYLWLLVKKTTPRPSGKLIVLTGLISGLCFLTREESILFILPMLGGFVWISRPELKKTILLFAIVLACFVPQLAVQKTVTNSAFTSGRQEGYGKLTDLYFQPRFLQRNFWETIVDSRHYPAKHPAKRPALLQAQPWLWVSPLGILLILFMKKYPKGLKLFVIVSLLLMTFYLSGYNMSADKLRFHCLRYVMPGLIALDLGVLVLAREILLAGKTGFVHARKKLSA